MHRSRLCGFVIDCQGSDVAKAAEFWSAALGRKVRPSNEEKYRELESTLSQPLLLVQSVPHESRIHMDIETDDVDAEATRLEGLGATRIEKIHTWWVMRAPTGQKFCVVRLQRGPLGADANEWGGGDAQPLALSAEQRALLALEGQYDGETKLWLDADKPPQVSKERLRVEPVLGGRFMRFTVIGFGEMTLGYHRDMKQYEMSWIDARHTGSMQMFSTGPLDALLGSYPAGDQRWGWRTSFSIDGGLVIRAFNISPDGREDRAFETEWKRS